MRFHFIWEILIFIHYLRILIFSDEIKQVSNWKKKNREVGKNEMTNGKREGELCMSYGGWATCSEKRGEPPPPPPPPERNFIQSWDCRDFNPFHHFPFSLHNRYSLVGLYLSISSFLYLFHMHVPGTCIFLFLLSLFNIFIQSLFTSSLFFLSHLHFTFHLTSSYCFPPFSIPFSLASHLFLFSIFTFSTCLPLLLFLLASELSNTKFTQIHPVYLQVIIY